MNRITSEGKLNEALDFSAILDLDDDDDDEEEDETYTQQEDYYGAQNDTKQYPFFDLKFDIIRPIVDSVVPKHSYLKSLTRVSVFNWNKIYKYPYFDEFNSKKNIYFETEVNGFNCSLLKSINLKTISTNDSENDQEKETNHEKIKEKEIKFKAKLCFKNYIDFYITPLSLASLERYFHAMAKATDINPNYLLTTLESKSQSYSNTLRLAAKTQQQSIEDIIKCTQISLSIPQIRFCAFQVGLAEYKKSTMIESIANPDELRTESLFVLCMHKIETQLIDDSTHKTAAIFKIEQIDTQFRRLHTQEQLIKAHHPIKLSCIRNERSKVSFQCFNQNEKIEISSYSGSIMYECAIEGISIKAVKEFNLNLKQPSTLNDTPACSTPTITSINSDNTLTDAKNFDKEKTQSDNNNRLSLCEFDINKIWFSFPEPPVSPKGKRKIPYNRYEWNLLSSVSPAVISWLCAFQRVAVPFREFIEKLTDNEMRTLAALVAGAHRHKDEFLSSLKIPNSNKQYLCEESLCYLNDPNCRLVKILRLYLLNYSYYLEQDLKIDTIPERKWLKRGIEELLISWSPIIRGITNDDDETIYKKIGKFNNINPNLFHRASYAKNNGKLIGFDFNQGYNRNSSNFDYEQQQYRFTNEIRQIEKPYNPSVSSQMSKILLTF
jgi:hypothetical protein